MLIEVGCAKLGQAVFLAIRFVRVNRFTAVSGRILPRECSWTVGQKERTENGEEVCWYVGGNFAERQVKE